MFPFVALWQFQFYIIRRWKTTHKLFRDLYKMETPKNATKFHIVSLTNIFWAGFEQYFCLYKSKYFRIYIFFWNLYSCPLPRKSGIKVYLDAYRSRKVGRLSEMVSDSKGVVNNTTSPLRVYLRRKSKGVSRGGTVKNRTRLTVRAPRTLRRKD